MYFNTTECIHIKRKKLSNTETKNDVRIQQPALANKKMCIIQAVHKVFDPPLYVYIH